MSKYKSGSMSNYWAMGFVGGLMMVAAGVLFILSPIVGCAGSIGNNNGSGGTVLFVLSIVLAAGGSYMRYLSRQAQFDPTADRSSANVSVAIAPIVSATSDISPQADSGTKRFVGDANLSNSGYKIFLVESYGIRKNDVLEGFIFDGNIYQSVEAALEAADSKYKHENG